jgi:hypothetical protein
MCYIKIEQYYDTLEDEGAVEREFSAAGQVVNQRISNLDPTTVNNILFPRSIENNKVKD